MGEKADEKTGLPDKDGEETDPEDNGAANGGTGKP